MLTENLCIQLMQAHRKVGGITKESWKKNDKLKIEKITKPTTLSTKEGT